MPEVSPTSENNLPFREPLVPANFEPEPIIPNDLQSFENNPDYIVRDAWEVLSEETEDETIDNGEYVPPEKRPEQLKNFTEQIKVLKDQFKVDVAYIGAVKGPTDYIVASRIKESSDGPSDDSLMSLADKLLRYYKNAEDQKLGFLTDLGLNQFVYGSLPGSTENRLYLVDNDPRLVLPPDPKKPNESYNFRALWKAVDRIHEGLADLEGNFEYEGKDTTKITEMINKYQEYASGVYRREQL